MVQRQAPSTDAFGSVEGGRTGRERMREFGQGVEILLHAADAVPAPAGLPAQLLLRAPSCDTQL